MITLKVGTHFVKKIKGKPDLVWSIIEIKNNTLTIMKQKFNPKTKWWENTNNTFTIEIKEI